MTKKQMIKAEEVKAEEVQQEETPTITIPSYLQRIINNKPQGGDGGIVYAGDYGWVCEYQRDGSKEILEEFTGLAQAFTNHGLDKFGQPLQPGAVISTNITVKVLNMLALEDIKLLATPLGITEGSREELISQLIEKLQIK